MQKYRIKSLYDNIVDVMSNSLLEAIKKANEPFEKLKNSFSEINNTLSSVKVGEHRPF
ncbi:hypothetical protein PQ689_03145 [Thermoanaerobacterium thermosaccharolyticum]